MRTVVKRLHRLERATIADERECTAGEAIVGARGRRLAADYEEHTFPGWFDGCRGDAEHINRAYKWLRENPSEQSHS